MTKRVGVGPGGDWKFLSPSERCERARRARSHMDIDEVNAKKSRSMKKFWARLTPEEKELRLRESFFSDASVSKWREFYANMTYEERLARTWQIHTLGAREKANRSVRNRFRGMTSEEIRQHLGRSMHSDQGKENSRCFWRTLSPKEKQRRLGKTIHSPEGKRNAIESGRNETLRRFYREMTSEERLRRARKAFLNPEAVLKSRRTAAKPPSTPEVWLGGYLDEYFPDQWMYNGDGSCNVTIGGKVPDFVSTNGWKAVIEVFGGLGYYHSLDDVPVLEKHYRDHGYHCLILWDYELRDVSLVNSKLWNFHEWNKLGAGTGR